LIAKDPQPSAYDSFRGSPFEKSQGIFEQIGSYPAPQDKLLLLGDLENAIWAECRDVTDNITPDLFNSALVFIIMICSERESEHKRGCTCLQLESTLFLLQQFIVDDFGRLELMLTKFEVAIRALENRDNTVLFGSCPELPRLLSSRMLAQPSQLRAQSLDYIRSSFDATASGSISGLKLRPEYPQPPLQPGNMDKSLSSFDGSMDISSESVHSFYVN